MKIQLKPTLKQHLAWQALKRYSEVFFGGGAGGGKSWWLCETRLINCYLYPGYKSFIGREELKRLMQSTYVTWCKVCAFHGIPKEDWKLNGQYNYIDFRNGSRVDLLDLKFLPSDPLYERFGSLEFTDGAIEEAGEVHFLAYDVLKSRIGRHLNEEFGLDPTMAISGNPKKNWTYKEFYRKWKEGTLPKDTKFIQSLYKDNEYTAESYGEQLAKINDTATKQRLMYGNWEYDDDPAKMLEYDEILDLFTNPVEPDLNNKFLSCDVARLGKDKTVAGIWHGLVCTFKTKNIIGKTKVNETVEMLIGICDVEKIQRSKIIIDEDGVGGGVVDYITGCKGFVNNSRPIKTEEEKDAEKLENVIKQNYANLKTQCAYKFADMARKGLIKIICQDEATKQLIIEELEQLKKDKIDKEGKLFITSKDDVKENIGRSPDYLDTLIMRMYFELQPKQELYIC